MNWVDLSVIAILALFAAHGWRRGFIILLLELVGFILAVAVPLLFYSRLTPVLAHVLGWPGSFAKAGSFMVLWFAAWIFYALTARRVYRLIPQFIRKSVINKAAGTIPSMIKGTILVALLLTLIVVFPSPGLPKQAVLDSAIGGEMVKLISAAERVAANIFVDAIQDTLTFLTIDPSPVSAEKVKLAFKTSDVVPDAAAERKMFILVNQERKKRGLKPLVYDAKLQAVARSHSKDMFKRGYFSHVNPDGVNPFQRMKKNKVKYAAAGENLAFAPTVEIAHRGLMKSPGHKANILSKEFSRIGIGAVKSDAYGIMFSQEFTD